MIKLRYWEIGTMYGKLTDRQGMRNRNQLRLDCSDSYSMWIRHTMSGQSFIPKLILYFTITLSQYDLLQKSAWFQCEICNLS